mgnify:CR=1 FL=1
MDKTKVGVLGATGAVGQFFVKMLSDHPMFELTSLAASERSAGMKYLDAVGWALGGDPPEVAREMRISKVEFEEVSRDGIELVFSALPADEARNVEAEFARRGIPVFSNTKTFRLEPDVPLLIPEVNPEQLALIEIQRKRGWKSFIVTSPNCTTTILALALKPLHDLAGIKRMRAVSMNAISGAGLRGLGATEIYDNLIPFISGEEEKLERETKKIFGEVERGSVAPLEIDIFAACTRVPVLHGHTIAVFVEVEKEVNDEEVFEALSSFRGIPQEKGLPTAPEKPVVVRSEVNRPQPRLDRDEGGGMSTVVGRLSCRGKEVRMVVLGHNLVRGAAGNTILNAELAIAEGVL